LSECFEAINPRWHSQLYFLSQEIYENDWVCNNPSRYDNKRCKSSAIFFWGRKETTMKIKKHNLTMNPTHANQSIENTTQHTITSLNWDKHAIINRQIKRLRYGTTSRSSRHNQHQMIQVTWTFTTTKEQTQRDLHHKNEHKLQRT
jgi:hypothetical protein